MKLRTQFSIPTPTSELKSPKPPTKQAKKKVRYFESELTARKKASSKVGKRFIPNVPLDPIPPVSAVQNPPKGSVHPEVRQIKTIRG